MGLEDGDPWEVRLSPRLGVDGRFRTVETEILESYPSRQCDPIPVQLEFRRTEPLPYSSSYTTKTTVNGTRSSVRSP